MSANVFLPGFHVMSLLLMTGATTVVPIGMTMARGLGPL
jgi:hypothetical protein